MGVQPTEEVLKMSEWRDYQQLVISELERLNSNFEKLADKLQDQGTELAVMKVKSSLWGSLGGIFTIAVALLIDWMKKH